MALVLTIFVRWKEVPDRALGGILLGCCGIHLGFFGIDKPSELSCNGMNSKEQHLRT